MWQIRNTSFYLFFRLLKSVLRGKIVFFDTTPVGQILNRFSSDLYTVDDSLPFILNIFLANVFGVLGPLVVVVGPSVLLSFIFSSLSSPVEEIP